MPLQKQPLSLKSAALRALTSLLTYDVRVVMSMCARRHQRRLRWIADCVRALPEATQAGVVTAALQCADTFLGYRNNHPARRVLDHLLAALLPNATRRLALTVAESFSLREALIRRLQELPQLRELTLTESMHLHTSLVGVLVALPKLRQLTAVRVPWLCSDALARALAENCPLLEQLDASNSARLTDRGVDALAFSCPRLRVVLLSDCGVTEAGYALLLAALPGLQRIGRCPALATLVCGPTSASTENPKALLALTEWDSDAPPNAAAADRLPALRSVTLSDVLVSPREAADENVGQIPDRVQQLRASWLGQRDHPMRLPLRLTASLTHLDLMTPVLGVADVVMLGRQCPLLRVLKLGTLEVATDPGVVPLQSARTAPFACLVEFHLNAEPGPLLEYVLRHARAIVTVCVKTCVSSHAPASWTDAHMRRVMAANPLSELASLALVCRVALTMESVFMLVLGCPKLRLLCDLGEWDVSETQVCELQELVTLNNWDLKVVMIGS